MSFDTLKVAELKVIAEDFAVDTEGLKNKKDIIAALSEEGVSWSVYQKTKQEIEDNLEEIEIIPRLDPKKVDADSILVRMTRENYRYSWSYIYKRTSVRCNARRRRSKNF